MPPDADLILGDDELARVREQLARHPWYAGILAGFRQRVEELVQRRPAIPVAKGRAFFESCPEDNARLTFDPYAPTSHVCPRCGRDWQGEVYDLSWVRQFQEWHAERLVEAGILYRIEADERHARVVRDALRHFATRYRDYPLANNLLGPTRLFQSTYLEAFWLVDMVAAYDLTRSSPSYEESDHSAVRELFYESSAVVRSFDEGISNRQAFNNAGMGAVALLYGDDELLDHVLEGPHGFSFHMRESLLEDGIWYEGETYHFATLDHLLDLAEMARHRDIDLYRGESGHGALKPMLDGPLQVMLPDLTFPSRKDSWFGRGVGYHKEIYELGYARYGDERYGALLAHAYEQGAERSELGWRGFLYLVPELAPAAEAQPLQTTCEPMPGTGVAVLRRDDGRTYASLEYGHYGGGHGHPDRLHLTLFADGRHWLVDPGTGWYHVPELGWYRSTIAHNTVAVDGRLQSPAEGRLTAFGDAGGLQVAQARVQGVAEAVEARRTLCLGDGFLVDLFEVSSTAAGGDLHTFDWACHLPGQEGGPSVGAKGNGGPLLTEKSSAPRATIGKPEMPSLLGDRDGYEFLRNVHELPPGPLDVVVEHQGKKLRAVQLGDFEAYAATAPGIPLQEDEPLGTVVVRQSGGAARYATLWVWGDDAAAARFSQKEGLLDLELGERRYRFMVDESDGIAIGTERGGELVGLAWFCRREASLHGVKLEADRPQEAAALVKEGQAWRAELTDDFGEVSIEGLPAGGVDGLPAGAGATVQGTRLLLRQRPGAAVWLEVDTPLTLFAGCRNEIVLNTSTYGAEQARSRGREAGRRGREARTRGRETQTRGREDLQRTAEAPEVRLVEERLAEERLAEVRPPEVRLPVGWELMRLDQGGGAYEGEWRLEVQLPSVPRTEGELAVELGGEEFTFPYQVRAPLSAQWRVVSGEDSPAVVLEIRDERGTGGTVELSVDAPWLGELEPPSSLELPADGSRVVRLPLPLRPPEASAAAATATGDPEVWPLAGLEEWSGEYEIAACVWLEGFRGVSRARLPLYWSAQRQGDGQDCRQAMGAQRLRLAREEQALWSDRRWRNPADASAGAEVWWSPSGMHLSCRVVDDVHVSAGNDDDLYENDSVQIYFDMRRDHHVGGSFAPGVAAYVLAPAADRDEVRVQAIAGNREISNRGARAGWFSAAGVEATSRPTADGYLIEAFFPWSSLGAGPLRPGQVIGFDLSMSDNDGTWYRNTLLLWSGSRGRRCYIRGSYHDPREFGWLIVGG